VQFEGTSNGVKWYSVVIAATIAAIAIGIGVIFKNEKKERWQQKSFTIHRK
jgi:hypothetical protein